MPPHNLPLTMIGTGILWFGWAGFNAGSALAANGVAAAGDHEHVPRRVGRDARLARWSSGSQEGKPTTLGAASGAVAGLVAITPCAGFVGGMAPIYIGAIAGVVCCLALGIKKAVKFDDSLDVIAVHLVGGLVGLDPARASSPTRRSTRLSTNEGVFLGGGAELLKDQVVASVVTLAYSFVVSLIIAKVIDTTMGLRVTRPHEDEGLDLSQHGETAYSAA